MFPLIPWTDYIFKLRQLDFASECLKDDIYLQLNEDEKAMILNNLLYILCCAFCVLIDFVFLLATILLFKSETRTS